MTERFYWKAKMVKNGPWVPVATFFDGPLVDGEILDRSPRWQALVRLEKDGREVLQGDSLPIAVDGVDLRNVEKIDEEEYTYLLRHIEWAVNHAPHHPDAQPTKKAVDPHGKSIRP